MPRPDLVGSIDGLLKQRGSPMAGMGNVFVAAGQKYGVDPRLVVSISGIESGFGVHTLGAHNAWGWGPGKPFGSWAEGIASVTQGLASGYISKGLRTPDQIVKKYSPGSAGNDEGNWASTVNQFMKQLGAPISTSRTMASVPSAKTSVPKTSVPKTSAFPKTFTPSVAGLQGAAFQNLGDIAMHGHINSFDALSNMLGGIQYDKSADEMMARYGNTNGAPSGLKSKGTTAPSAPSAVPATSFSSKWLPTKGKIIGTPYAGTHTIGNWQSDNALDISLPVGTPIYAPVGGKLGNTGYLGSPGDTGRFAGERINLYGGGQGFYFAHLSKLAPGIAQGATVQKGQLLGYTGSANGVAHLHFGVEKGTPFGYVPQS